MRIRAVVFDAYGTLFDVYSVGELAETLFPGQGRVLAELWRDRQIDYTRLRTLSGRYRPFSEVTRDALRFAVQKLKLAASDEMIQRLLDQYDRLEVFPENRDALSRLRELGLPLAILSNGDPPMLAKILAHSGLGPYFDHVLSADQVGSFKTAPEVYRLAPNALGLPCEEMLFVSSNGWDACGARWFGYPSFWINRTSQPAEELGIIPNASGSNMDEVVRFITAQ
ncbi:MAG: haloacid dehalogenase type II [Burkholderiaceae bacterium]|jgi:2-haloacid dehalogenase